MINGLSRLVSFLIAKAEQPIAIADNIEIQCPMLTSIMVGVFSHRRLLNGRLDYR